MAASVANAHAATAKEKAAETVLKALRCEQPMGQYKNVVKAVKTLGAKVDKEVQNEFHLPVPLELYGLPITSIALSDEEAYIVEIKGVKTVDVAKAANATVGGRGYERETKHGILSVQDGGPGAVKLMCETVYKGKS